MGEKIIINKQYQGSCSIALSCIFILASYLQLFTDIQENSTNPPSLSPRVKNPMFLCSPLQLTDWGCLFAVQCCYPLPGAQYLGQHSGELGRCWVVKWGQVAGTAGAHKTHWVKCAAEGQRTGTDPTTWTLISPVRKSHVG